MVNKIFLSVIATDFLFLVTGGITLGFSLVVQGQLNNAPSNGEDAVRKLVSREFPLTAGIANGVLMLIAFVLTLPGMWLPARGWLKLSSAAVALCSVFSLVLGIYIWVMTLRFKGAFGRTYLAQTPDIHDLMQTSVSPRDMSYPRPEVHSSNAFLQFKCCGYLNSTSPAFVTDSICPSPAAAALAPGCAGPIGNFANTFLDQVFTALFAFVGMSHHNHKPHNCTVR
ncbi:hypothetical protein HJFPF1_04881 [Paramyrothecium foliicola]|nr:hypothetical protein HJFPF1_04881 [Paramyrothecium foliicola]